MITSAEIRNVTFSNSMAGYKKDEVDILLDRIEVDLDKYEAALKHQESKINSLEAQVTELKESQSSIQSVLLNAQKLADKIVEDAKNESRRIIGDAQENINQMTEKSKQIAVELDAKATEKKERLEGELSGIIKEVENKKSLIERATDASVRGQQELFDKLKKEMADFRNEIIERYKEHLKLLADIPAEVDLDPETSAKIIKENYKEPEKEASKENPDESQTEEDEPEISEEPASETEISITQTFDVNKLNFDDNI